MPSRSRTRQRVRCSLGTGRPSPCRESPIIATTGTFHRISPRASARFVSDISTLEREPELSNDRTPLRSWSLTESGLKTISRQACVDAMCAACGVVGVLQRDIGLERGVACWLYKSHKISTSFFTKIVCDVISLNHRTLSGRLRTHIHRRT